MEEVPPRLRITDITGPNSISLDLEVQFTEKYPDEIPEITILVNAGKLSELDVLSRKVVEEAEQSCGMAMVFTLVTFIEDWLSTNIKSHVPQVISFSTQKNADSIGKERENKNLVGGEEPTMKGGAVTVESFLAWNAKFMAEKSKESSEVSIKKDSNNVKLTGRELFEQNKILAESDAVHFNGEGDVVVLDETAYAGLDDLDIDDNLLEDEEDN